MRHVSVKPPICSNPRQTLGSESKCTTSAAGNGDNSIMMWQKKLALTISLVGLQIVWTIEMGYGTPYLVSLGLARPVLSLVWLAGPLSGLLMQPLIGAWSDRCQSRYGRRRPFIVAGTVCVVISLQIVAHCITLAQWITQGLSIIPLGITTNQAESPPPPSVIVTPLAIALAFIGFYGLDFGLNAVQASCRSLIVDCLPVEQQASGNSWASAAISMGNIIGYSMGSVDMIGLLGDTQIKSLSTAASLLLIACVTLTCQQVKETPFTAVRRRHFKRKRGYQIVHSLVRAAVHLPRSLRLICFAQFFAWIGWFPFNFFSSEYIKDLWLAQHDGDVDAAIRAGNLALLLFSCVSILAAIILPFITNRFSLIASNPSGAGRSAVLSIVWTISHLLFAILMLISGYVRDAWHSIALVSAVGVCWAVATWVPFTLIGEQVAAQNRPASGSDDLNYLQAHGDGENALIGSGDKETEHLVDQSSLLESYGSFPASDDSVYDSSDYGSEPKQSPPIIDGSSAGGYYYSGGQSNDHGTGGDGDAGVLLGIHNFFVVLPQFLATGLSGVIFEMTAGQPESEAISWMWFIGGFTALLAAIISYSI